MALSDLQVFQEYAYSTMTEVLAYNVNLFNEASRGGLVLRSAAHQGDYSVEAFWAKISGLVRRRDAYGSSAVSEKVLTQLAAASVKVAAGIAPVRIDPSMLKWIQKSPEEAGAVIGRQMAGDNMGEMLNTGLLCYNAAVAAQATNYYDGTAGNASLSALTTTKAKLGDRSEEVVCWVIHSKCLFDIYGAALANSNILFSFGNIRVTHDGFGVPFVVTDSASLVVTAAPNNYYTCGLTPAGVVIDQNTDFQDNVQTINGNENIVRTYQAEWSYNLALKGFTWDMTNGGRSPTNTALGTATNWDKTSTSFKDLAGVVLKSL
jgi:hypothetical protein